MARNILRQTLSLITLLALLFGSGARANAQCAREALASFGPMSPYGFPDYYVDQNALALTGCVDPNDPMCVLGPLPDPGAPLDVSSGNFHEEFFYWLATATVPTPGGDAILVLGIEGAWANETILDGNQVTFSRYRVRVDVPPGPSSAGVNPVTHPWGVPQCEGPDGGTGTGATTPTEASLHTQTARGVTAPPCAPPPVGNRFTTPLDPTLARISRYLEWNPAESL